MISLVRNIWKHRQDLRSIHKSVYFNFHYLPFKQAIHLPILFYKPKFLSLEGQVQLYGEAKYGMIRLGYPLVSIFPNSGIVFENNGGKITFGDGVYIGNNSYISIGKKGCCKIGNRTLASTSLKLVCYYNVAIGERTRFGWNCMVMDSDMHKLTKLSGGYSKGYSSVIIGSNNWIGNGCLIMKRTETPNYCIVSARTVLSGKIDVPEYSVVGLKSEIEQKAHGLWRNIDDDTIDY